MPSEILEMIKVALPSLEGREQMLGFIYGERLSKGFVSTKALNFFNEVSEQAALGYLKMYTQDLENQSLEIECPVHVFVGEKDHPPFTKEILESTIKPKGDISWSFHEQAGHAPAEEAPPFYVASVEAFFNSLSL